MASGGCAARRFYPICVYGQIPSLHSEEDLKNKLNEFVKLTAGGRSKISIGPNGRIAVIKTSKKGHLKLIDAWARTACIGPTGYEAEYNDYKKCVDLITDTLAKHQGIMPLGQWSDGDCVTLYCGQPLTSGKHE
jgi:hypothetical protein